MTVPVAAASVPPSRPPQPFESEQTDAAQPLDQAIVRVTHGGRAWHVGRRQQLATALAKLQALTPSREGRLALALDGTVTGWERGAKDYSAVEGMILELVKAIVSRQRCHVEYQAPWRKALSRFPFDPYRLLSVHGGLYCIGKVPAYANLATLAIERIRSLTLTSDSFTVDAAFDPKRLEAAAFGVTLEPPKTVVVRFREDQAPYVREREWHPTQRIRDLPDGRVELTFRAGGMFEIVRWASGNAAAGVPRAVAD